MTDDIVTRLRGKYQGQLPICDEAADEIERLQKELQKATSMIYQLAIKAEMLAEKVNKFG